MNCPGYENSIRVIVLEATAGPTHDIDQVLSHEGLNMADVLVRGEGDGERSFGNRS